MFCGGNCVLPTDLSASSISFFYPSVGAKGKSGNAPNAGHNLFQHLGAQAFFGDVIEFVKAIGL